MSLILELSCLEVMLSKPGQFLLSLYVSQLYYCSHIRQKNPALIMDKIYSL